MAHKGKGKTPAEYFRQLFADHPELLGDTTNDAVLAHYRRDHGLSATEALPEAVRKQLANTKASLRRKQRRSSATSPRSAKGLLALEELIDECLMLARSLDRDDLTDVIHLLRKARNKIVWTIGK